MYDLATFSFRNQVRCVRQGKFKSKEISESSYFYANKMQHNEIYFLLRHFPPTRRILFSLATRMILILGHFYMLKVIEINILISRA